MTSLQQRRGSTGSQASEVNLKRVDFTYDVASQLSTITRYADLTTSSPVAKSSYAYDGLGRLTGLTHVKGLAGATIAGYGWEYDEASRITAFTNSVYSAENATYSYDPTGQLIGADRTGTSTDETYTYDDNGNRTNTGYSTGTNNQLLSDGTYNYTYDNEGNRLSKENISTGEREEYEWDHRNRLTKVTFIDANDDVVKVVDNQYDAFNRWIGKTLDPDGETGSAAVTQTSFIHDGNQIILEFDDPTRFDLITRYLWGPSVDQLLAVEEVDDILTAGETLWTLGDNLNSIRDVVDDAGDLLSHTSYDAFGNVLSQTAALDLLFGYTGRALDKDTGLQNNLNRWYDSTVGKWISEDPIGFTAGDANLGRHVGNSPTNATDPSGLCEVEDDSRVKTVEIVVQSFIPDDFVHVPQGVPPKWIWFAGDDRFHYGKTVNAADNDYRTRIHVKIPQNDESSHTTDAGVTYRYDPDGTKTSDEAKEGKTMHHQVGETYSSTERDILITGSGKNPLAVGPWINFRFKFKVDFTENSVVFLGGSHDGFPAYEVFVKTDADWKQVYGYFPATYWGPGSLFGSGDQKPTGPSIANPVR